MIANEQELHAIVGTPAPRPVLKERQSLMIMPAFIDVTIPLAGDSGRRRSVDVSTKGDVPGFVLRRTADM